jgi:putative membrane protein
LLAAWNANPLPSLALFMVAYLYINGLSRWPQPSHPISRWQQFSFFAGLLAIFLALQSPIDPLAGHQFSFHQLQHLLLRMVGPLLVLGGAPLTPMLRGLPQWALMGIVRPVVRDRTVRKSYNWLTNPVVTSFIFLGALYLWQVPDLHDVAVRHDSVHELMHLTMLLSGFLFWWVVIDPRPHRSRLHYGLRVLYLGLIVIPNTVLGAGIVFNENLLYDSYYDFPQPLSITPLTDQQIGGLLLWVIGDMMSILAAGVVMIMWYQREQAQEETWGTAPD